jgi:hypothetical protein
MDKWISVEDRLPDGFANCLVSDGEKVEEAIWTKRTKNDTWKFVFTSIKNITHWQPLPSAPGEINSGKIDDGDLKIAWELANTTDKPFFVDTVRKLIRQYDKEEISLSKFVEVLNITAYKWKSGKVDEKDSGIESHLKSAYKRNSDFGQIINKQIKEIDYWKKRCEAAEILVNSMSNHFKNDKYSYKYYSDWEQLKSLPKQQTAKVKVYQRDDCPFVYCDSPDGECERQNKCHHK